MKTGRNMIIAIMITFCFTVSLFMVIPIRSATSPYDPWIDYNDDGKISLSDLVSLANSYGTTGDPTKNVTVTNFPLAPNGYSILAVNGTDTRPSAQNDYLLIRGTFNITINGMSPVLSIFCGGHSELSLLWRLGSFSITPGDNGAICFHSIGWDSGFGEESNETIDHNVCNVTIGDTFTVPHSFITQTKAPYCYLWFVMDGGRLTYTTWQTIDYCVYLRNE